jgi:hypothetical protein
MIATPDVPILLIHSSCRGGDHDESYSSSYSDTATTAGDGGDKMFGRDDLTEQPITCDLLLLPEYHSSEVSSDRSSSSSSASSSSTTLRHEVLHFPQNHINPCSISNVMTLENLPEWWKTGPVLLSLTSCGILYNNNNNNNSSEDINDESMSASSILLPVETNPSTFLLDFGHQKLNGVQVVDTGLVVEEEDGTDDTVTIISKKLTEIVVEFDFTEASRQRDEILLLLEDTNDAPLDEDDSKETTKTKYDSSNNYTEQQQHDKNSHKGANDTSFYHGSPKLEESSKKRMFDTIANKDDFEARTLLLAQLNARMESDARTMDRLLRTCGFVGVSLMAMLLWAIYQYFRSGIKSDAFSKEVRESSKKSREVLQEAIDGLHHYHHQQHQQKPMALDVLFKDTMTKNKQERTTTTAAVATAATEATATVKPLGGSGGAILVGDSNGRSMTGDISSTSSEVIPSSPVSNRTNTDGIHHQCVSSIDYDDNKGESNDNSNEDDSVSSDHPSKKQRMEEEQESCTAMRSNTPMLNRNGAIWDKLAEEKERRAKLRAKLTIRDCGTSTTAGTVSTKGTQEANSKNDSATKSSKISSSTIVQPPELLTTSQRKDEENHSENGTETEIEIENKIKNDTDDAEATKYPKSTSASVQLPDFISSPEEQGEKKLCFLGSFSRRNHSPVCDSPARLGHSSKRIVHNILSPCSQLAKEWNEGKTIRRSNLAKRKKRYLLKPGTAPPSSASAAADTTTAGVSSSYVEDGKVLFESPFLSRGPPPTENKSQYSHHHLDHQYNISGPPKLRSIAPKKGGSISDSSTIIGRNDTSLSKSDDDSVQNSNSTTDSDKEFRFIRATSLQKTPPPPIPSLIQETPLLCYTPASEDDSFVDDYW